MPPSVLPAGQQVRPYDDWVLSPWPELTGRWRAILLVTMMIMAVGGAPGLTPRATAESPTVTVAVQQLKPFAIKSSDQWSGFTVDLWEKVASRLHWATKYVEVDDLAGQLNAVETGAADVAIGAISITADREKHFDFSQPILDTGLQVMVARTHGPSSRPELDDVLDLVWSRTMLGWLAAAAIIALPAPIVWLIRRRHPESAVSRSASGPWARSVAILWAVTGIVFVAVCSASLTTTLMMGQTQGRISGPNDLYDKSVCTVSDTTSSDYLAALGVSVTAMPTVEDCYKALAGGFDAVVFDAPILRNYTAHEGAKVARMVGPTFHDEDYGFLYRLGSDLQKPVDGALLALREDGTYRSLHQKWFGTDEG
jgi:polar amino acid transport system substrate-binding protein